MLYTNKFENIDRNLNSTDMESLIAFVWNKHKGLSNKENIEYISDAFVKTERVNNIIEYYNDNKKKLNTIISCIPEDCGLLKKLPRRDSVVKDIWYELGDFDYTPNSEPKTDIISDDNKYRFSIKKQNDSQILSAHECEAKATLINAANKCNINKNIIIQMLFKKDWSSFEGKNETAYKEKMRNYNAELTNKLQAFVDENNKFKNEVLIEALSGKVKFGANSQSCANCVLTWNDNNEYVFYKNIKDYINILDCKFMIRFKNHDYRISTAFTIE